MHDRCEYGRIGIADEIAENQIYAVSLNFCSSFKGLGVGLDDAVIHNRHSICFHQPDSTFRINPGELIFISKGMDYTIQCPEEFDHTTVKFQLSPSSFTERLLRI